MKETRMLLLLLLLLLGFLNLLILVQAVLVMNSGHSRGLVAGSSLFYLTRLAQMCHHILSLIVLPLLHCLYNFTRLRNICFKSGRHGQTVVCFVSEAH